MGTKDATSAWARASFNLFKQLAICFGKLDSHKTPDPPMPTLPEPMLVVAAPTAAPTNGEVTHPVTTVVFNDGMASVAACSTATNGEVVNPTTAPCGEVPTPANYIRSTAACVGIAPPHTPTATATVFGPEDLPKYFDPRHLEKYNVKQVAWWDESRHKCCLKSIQGANGYNFITRIKREN